MNIYEILKQLNVKYQEVEHDPIYTVKEGQKIKSKIEGISCKNLFLTNHKGLYVLVILKDITKVNINQIAKSINSSHLSFATKEELMNILGLTVGCVSPFGIINDKKKQVKILLEDVLLDKKLLFHPNINTKTLAITTNDLKKFIIWNNHEYQLIHIK
ncbi:MAG: prolyl-tRNA synthetase associated domain-containing protein [Bacilli bacterium]|jgi:Ala-tRNA(Pro) deacylase|nr:prolyl-tRNA synthetase associated domain-containing protein [Bacilli bacterium]